MFVTTTVTSWLPIFNYEDAASTALTQLDETSECFDVSIVAYVLMPSHFHALLGFKNVGLLSRFMQIFKSLSSRKIKALHTGELKTGQYESDRFRLWKPRFDDLPIISEEQFKIKVNNIHNNAVKAGLVSNAVDWPYSSARQWMLYDNVDKSFKDLIDSVVHS
ncbi:MAG: transposase [Candidatus Zixiibacteriota bacterium]